MINYLNDWKNYTKKKTYNMGKLKEQLLNKILFNYEFMYITPVEKLLFKNYEFISIIVLF